MSRKEKEYWVEKFNLQPHPKGEKGFFKETFRDEMQVSGVTGEQRAASTLIYFLHEYDTLQSDTIFFKVKHSEAVHWYYGDPITLYTIQDGELKTVVLGEEEFQHVFPRDTWFTRLCLKEGGYTLMGCSVSPGFDFNDLETTEYKNLQHLIKS